MIISLLDTDFYKILMGQVVFNQFPNVRAHYRFFNRNNAPFASGFKKELEHTLEQLSAVKLSETEYKWLCNFKYLKPHFLEWFRNYSFCPGEVNIRQYDEQLFIDIAGPWYKTIYWEVPLMAIISELYFKGATPDREWEGKLADKAKLLSSAGVRWADFGTRRRFSRKVQDKVVATASEYKGFLGTSNVRLAMTYNCRPIGTTAHEGPMAMQVLSGLRNANVAWMDAWIKEYRGELGIALPDTLTTDVFLKDFDGYYARVFDGVRQDSGDPFEFGEKMLKHYRGLKIDPRSKRIIFSDNLNAEKAIKLNEAFSDFIQPAFGIGTNLTNDVGVKPLNMVIKLVAVDNRQVEGSCVKLSDEKGKYTGEEKDISRAKEILKL